MNILIYLDSFDGKIPEPELKTPYKLWSGRQLVSMAFPKGLNVNIKNGSHSDNEEDKLWWLLEEEKIDIANKILERNSSTSRETLEIMGFGIKDGKAVRKIDVEW